jgi:hypothetical protein
MKNRTNRQILERLEDWGGKESQSSKFLDFCRMLLSIQAGAEERMGAAKSKLTKNIIKDRILAGIPLLRFDEIEINWALAEDIFAEVAATLADYVEIWGEVPHGLIKSGPKPRLSKEIAKAWFEGSEFPSAIAGEEINAYIQGILIHQTLRPFLTNSSEILRGFVRQEDWRRGYCPICGSSPDFAFLEREVGERWLLCSRCDAQWLFQRLECPCCRNKDTVSLSFFTNDDGIYRLYVCDKCHVYLKAIDLRNAPENVFVPFERFLTFSIDQQGLEMGYRPISFAGLPRLPDA